METKMRLDMKILKNWVKDTLCAQHIKFSEHESSIHDLAKVKREKIDPLPLYLGQSSYVKKSPKTVPQT